MTLISADFKVQGYGLLVSVGSRMFRYKICLSIVLSVLLSLPLVAKAQVKIVTSIKPLHSLASIVTEGISTPSLIIDGLASPHDFQLRPSKVRMLQNADLILWVGDDLETFLVKPLRNIDSNKLISVMEMPDLTLLPLREHVDFSKDEHDHAHKGKHGDEHADPHVWLDPNNATVIVQNLAQRLAELDAENAQTYKENANTFAQKVVELNTQVQTLITPIQNSKFFIFHDAIHYFEDAFGIFASQAITPSIEQKVGAKRVRQLQSAFRQNSIECVFVEPQASKKLVELAVKGSYTKIAEVDVTGVRLSEGPDLYRQLILNMATVMNTCLSPS